MKDRRFDATAGYIIGIFALFLAGLLLLVIFGAGTYRDTVEDQQARSNRRTILSYVAVCVKNRDSQGVLSVEKGAEGDMLVLREQRDGAGYVTSIYTSNGELMEEFRREETPAGSGEVQKIGRCRVFQVEQVEPQSIRVYLDGTGLLLHLRSTAQE